MGRKTKPWKRGNVSRAEAKQIVKLAGKGKSSLQLSKKFNRPARTIRRVLEREKNG